MRILAGFVNGESPGVATLYDFANRLLDGPYKKPSESAYRSSRRFKGNRGRFRRNLGDEKATRKALSDDLLAEQNEQKVEYLVRMALPKLKDPLLPKDFQNRIEELLMKCAVLPSAELGLLGDMSKLTVSGDGSSLPSHANGNGHSTCTCRQEGISALTDFDSGSITGLDAGDVIRLVKSGQSNEWLYTTSVGSPNVLIRGYNNTTAQVWSGAAATTFRGISGTWKAIEDWCNAFSQYVTASRTSYAAVGLPATSAKTYLTSGSEGSATSAEWQAAFDELRNHRVNHIVVLSNDSTIHAMLDTHLDWRWGQGNMEALGYVAAAASETLAQIKTRAKQIDSPNISLHFQGCTRRNYANVSTAFAPWMMAVLEAAMRAGMTFGEGCEYKRLHVDALSYNAAIDLNDDGDTLTEFGICYASYWDGAYRFTRCVSTWTGNDDADKMQFDVRNSIAYALYKTRTRLKEKHLGRGQRQGVAASIKSTLKGALEELRDDDGAILEGSERVDGRIVPIPAFLINDIEINGNVAGYAFQITPAGANLFFVGDTYIKDFTDVA